MITRRHLLHLGLGASAAAALGGTGAASPAFAAPRTTAGALPVKPFSVPLTVPPVLTPLYSSSSTDYYAVVARKARAEILPGTSTELLTYNGSFPGPTIRARSGRRVVVQQINALDDPTSAHLHGGSIPEPSDGGRMRHEIPSFRTRRYTYPNRQPGATLWMHDHAHHVAAEHVYRGMSGAYLLEDDAERDLGLPSGKYDVPLILRDAQFDDDAQLVWKMNDAFNRTTLTVNGRPWPYLRVEGRKYRFRLVNSTNLRFFLLQLSDGSPITQIGSDGGLLEKPYDNPMVVLSPGERVDFVIDFARYRPGTELLLKNLAGPGPTEQVGQIMRFDVGERVTDPSRLPSELRTLPPLPEPTVERAFRLYMDHSGTDHRGYIDGRVFDPERFDTTVAFGTTEVWTVTNDDTVMPHNFHTHLVQFRLLERNGRPVDPSEAGLKDTVLLFPGQSARLQATFDTYRGVFPYHCHMLDHAAMGMMAQMEIV